MGPKTSHWGPEVSVNGCLLPAFTALLHRGKQLSVPDCGLRQNLVPFLRSGNKTNEYGMATFQLSLPKKTRSIRAGKVMLTCFFDENGPLMLEWLETGGTVNANRYCDTLRKLKTAINNRRCGMLSKGVILLQENARPHVAKVCKDLLQHFWWEVLHHPPLQSRPVALRFPCVRATKKSTEGTPVHRQWWGPRNHWRMVPHATQDFLCWRYPSSHGPMGHLFQPTRWLRADSMCYTDIVYVPLFKFKYIHAFKLNKPLHKFISPTFTWARLIHRTIKLWNQLTAEALATFPCKSHIFRTTVRRVIISEEKWRVFEGVVTKHPKVWWSEKWGVTCGEVKLCDVKWGEVKVSEVKWGDDLRWNVCIIIELCNSM